MTQTVPIKRGDVWRARLAFGAGHAQGGIRPVVVLQHDAINVTSPTILNVPFTSQLSTSKFAGTVLVQPDGQNGLVTPSIALVFQTNAIDRRFLVQRLGTLDAQSLDQILAALDGLIR